MFKGFELEKKLNPVLYYSQPKAFLGNHKSLEFPLVLNLNLLAHEMLHVKQKSYEKSVIDKNEREWQAYYENLFHKEFPLIPELSDFHKKAFANKALEYYNRMGENSELQLKYKEQKDEVEQLISIL